MKKAVPPLTSPRCADAQPPREAWERKIDNYDRSERRRNRRYRQMVIRLDHHSVGLIATDGSLPLDRISRLGPVDESPAERRIRPADGGRVERSGNVALRTSTN